MISTILNVLIFALIDEFELSKLVHAVEIYQIRPVGVHQNIFRSAPAALLTVAVCDFSKQRHLNRAFCTVCIASHDGNLPRPEPHRSDQIRCRQDACLPLVRSSMYWDESVLLPRQQIFTITRKLSRRQTSKSKTEVSYDSSCPFEGGDRD